MSKPRTRVSMFALHWSYAKQRRKYRLANGSRAWFRMTFDPQTRLFNLVVWQWAVWFGWTYRTGEQDTPS